MQEKDVITSKMYIFRKITQKLKNIFSITTTFYNFALKIETRGAKKVVEPISEIWNATNYAVVYVWFIHYLIKNIKICSVKLINSKSITFTIKNWNNSEWIQD